jgi:hypothetical protein
LLFVFGALLLLAGGAFGLYLLVANNNGDSGKGAASTDRPAPDGPGGRDLALLKDKAKDAPRDPPKDPPRPPPPPPLPPEEQKRVEQAVAAGVAYLKKQMVNQNTGAWNSPDYTIAIATVTGNNQVVGINYTFKVGYNALVALALMECGVPATDPSVKSAIEYVRDNCRTNVQVYDLALAILVLDKVDGPGDKALIQSMAMRLMHAQKRNGGWAYKTPDPLGADEERSLLAALQMTRPRSLNDLSVESSKDGPGRAKDVTPAEVYARATAPLGESVKAMPALLPPFPVDTRHAIDLDWTDNSNTQFALIALWVAGRHDVPTERALALTAQRFRASQKPNGWAYNPESAWSPNTAMTGAGLLGLGVGHGLTLRVHTDGKDPGKVDDPAIQKGMTALAAFIGTPLGPNAPRAKGRNREQLNLYALWTLERVGVLYRAQKIGDKDWYQWGAELLVDNQNDDGSWFNNSYFGATPQVDTAFALLFLKRANLVQDLSDKLEFEIGSSK